MVIAVDVSISTHWVEGYYSYVNNLLCKATKIIIWGNGAELTTDAELSVMKLKQLNSNIGCDTKIKDCLILLTELPEEKFNLIVITDGIVKDVDDCIHFMRSNHLRERINGVEICFFGNTKEMNMEINTIFDGISQTIYVNGSISARVSAKWLDCQRVDLDEFLRDINSAKASLIAKMNALSKEDKRLLIDKFRNYEKEKLREIAKEKTATLREHISNMYAARDVDAFVKMVRDETYLRSDAKKNLQKTAQECINLLQDQNIRNIYSLDNIQTITTDLVEMQLEDEDEDEEDENGTSALECDILYKKCRNTCMLINAPAQPLITDNLKKYAENPFYLLDNEDVVQRLVKCVENNVVDLKTFQQIEDKSKSPFTRQRLKTVFIFHGNADIDVHKLMSHNARAISILFGSDDKLPGSMALWLVIFLYVVWKRHPAWSDDILRDEIAFYARNASTTITFNRAISPNFTTSLEIALWYAVEVSPRAFPNSRKNRLRFFKRHLYTFYSDVFGKPTIDERVLELWELWECFVRHRTDPYLKAKVLAQIQHHKSIDGKIVLFEGECKTRFDCFLKKFHVDDVLNLYALLETCRNTTSLYENISNANTHHFKVMPITKDERESQLEHVQINMKTCQPFVMCPVTGLHWHQCAKPFNRRYESFYRLFRRYCIDKKEYPKNSDDLLLFASEKYFRFYYTFKIYNECHIYTVLDDVMQKFQQVMVTMDVAKYLKTVSDYQSEKLRLEFE